MNSNASHQVRSYISVAYLLGSAPSTIRVGRMQANRSISCNFLKSTQLDRVALILEALKRAILIECMILRNSALNRYAEPPSLARLQLASCSGPQWSLDLD